jgi:hypothetical protein
VITTPSRFHCVSLGSDPLLTKPDCWPLSLPATFTRSTRTPGTVFSTAQGSRDCGVSASSSLVRVVAVPTRLVSTTGVSAVTVTSSACVATFKPKVRFTFWPVVTTTSRFTVANPVMVTVSLYVPGSMLRNRNSPLAPVWVVRPPVEAPESATVAPGMGAAEASVTVP